MVSRWGSGVDKGMEGVDVLARVVVVEDYLDDLVLCQHEGVGVGAVDECIGCVVAG